MEDFEKFDKPEAVESNKPVVVAPTPPKEVKILKVNDRGALALASIEDQLLFAQRILSERLISDTFKTPQQVVIAFQYAKAMQINELLALKMMYVVNGRPCLYGEGPLSLVQRTGLVTSLREFFLDENGEEISVKNKNLKSPVFASVTQIRRRGDDEVQEDFFTLEDLAQAKLDIGKYGKKEVWEKWQRIMMRYKARSMALKSKFADLIAGIPIAEYDENFSPEMPQVTVPKNALVEEIENTYGNPKEEANPQPEAPR